MPNWVPKRHLRKDPTNGIAGSRTHLRSRYLRLRPAMFHSTDHSELSETEKWSSLRNELESLLDADEPVITTLSNAAAFIFTEIERLNWSGFYLFDGTRLVLGPFGGKPACTMIEIGKGVCGTAARDQKTIRVPDVNAFPGHIACDAGSQSEIVLPLVLPNGTLFGVLDLDSPDLDRFHEQDELGIWALANVIVQKISARPRKENSLALF
jgi:L-methionine (R)-S-oxide reductase